MTNPTVTCATCGRQRDCMRHIRADHPPTAAKRWLRQHCLSSGKPCVFTYRAGLEYRLALSPQNLSQE